MTQRTGIITPRAVVLPAIVALILIGGCSLGALDGFSDGEVPPPEAGAEASPDVDALVDASDAALPGDSSDNEPDTGTGVNLLANADFELGCAAWNATFGFIAESEVARSGTRSCKFCMDTNWEAYLEQIVTMPVESGDKYVGEIWLRAAAPTASLEDAGFVGSSLVLSAGANKDATDGPPISSGWSRITTLLTVGSDHHSLKVGVRLQQTGNPADVGNVICVYVDDAVLRPLE